MKNPMRKSKHSRLEAIGHAVSEHTADAGNKIRGELDDVAPKVAAAATLGAAAATKAAQSVAHSAAERSRPVRAEAASRGSAALSGLLGAVTPEQIERVSRRDAKRDAARSKGKIALLLAAAGGVVAWALWWKRSDPDMGPWAEEAKEPTEFGMDSQEKDGPQPPTSVPAPAQNSTQNSAQNSTQTPKTPKAPKTTPPTS